MSKEKGSVHEERKDNGKVQGQTLSNENIHYESMLLLLVVRQMLKYEAFGYHLTYSSMNFKYITKIVYTI